MNHYNTTKESGQQLINFNQIAKNQNELVLDFFKNVKRATPCICHSFLTGKGVINKHTPLTSIRRSISNLTEKGLLIKTDEKTIGLLGRPVYYWMIKTNV